MSHPVEQALWRVPGEGRPLPPAEPQAVFLFVGGPLDGERRHVEPFEGGHLRTYYRCLRCERPGNVFDSGQITTYEYRLQKLIGDGRVTAWYVGEDVADPFARLLAGYKPEKANG